MLLYVKIFSAMDHQAKWSPSCQDESLLGLSEGGEAENLVFKAVAVPSARFMPDGAAVTGSHGEQMVWTLTLLFWSENKVPFGASEHWGRNPWHTSLQRPSRPFFRAPPSA